LQTIYNNGYQASYQDGGEMFSNNNMNSQFEQQGLYDNYGNLYELQPQIYQNYENNANNAYGFNPTTNSYN